MDPMMVRYICGALMLVFVGIIVLRRKKNVDE
jgi:hypothetical protein